MSYTPRVPPQDIDRLLEYLDQEFVRVAQILNRVESGEYEVLYKSLLSISQALWFMQMVLNGTPVVVKDSIVDL